MQIEEVFQISVHALLDHKFRSFLTMLGIIFGVASVITMLSIGEGAKKQAIAKYKDLGVNNIIVREKQMSATQQQEMRAKFSPGLSINDANAIMDIVPDVQAVSPQAEQKLDVKVGDKSSKSTIIGVTPNFIKILNYKVAHGIFITKEQYDMKMKVCVLGAGLTQLLFDNESALGKMVKIGDQWLEVIGVMQSKALFTETVGELSSRDLNTDVYIPLSTYIKRFPKSNVLDSEITQVTININDSKKLPEASQLIKSIIDRHHFNNEDYNIVIPFELLKQEEKEREIYNFLLAAIAAISLLVGGIGIMNIMLATVMERTREIGIRRAIGAKKSDIMSQFVIEAVAISVTGGLIGVIVGVSLSLIVSFTTDVVTSIQAYSIVIAFSFSVIVGVCFGYLPAKNAASLKPIDALRYE